MTLSRKQIFLVSALGIGTLVFSALAVLFRPAAVSAFDGCTYTYSSSSTETIYIKCESSSRFGELNASVNNINDSSDPWSYQDSTLISGSGTEENTGHSITIPDFENTPSQGKHSVFGNGPGGRVSQNITVVRDGNDSDGMWTDQQLEDLASPSELTDEDRNCENAGGLGWIMCPVIYVIDNAINWVDGVIENLLDLDKGYYDNPGIKGAWTAIRNIAYIILIPIMLIMVIGTAIGFSAIDAYTVKRALPRLVAAVIFISLSYTICVFMIEFVDAIGRGILGILTAPFGRVTDINGNDIVLSELTLRHLFGPALLTSIAGLAVGTIGLLVILWIFGGGLLMAAAAAFMVLLLRQIFIVALLLLAPLAMLAWIFPGNDKLWKIWWNAFTKLLIMFPLIMGVIAVGRIFAFIIHESNPAGLDRAVLAPLMTMAAYMIPYAFIPFTFKLAGGVFSTITGGLDGVINSDARKKARATKRAEKFQRIGSENVFGGKDKLSKFANKAMSWTTYPGKNLQYAARGRNIPFISTMGGRIASGIEESGVEQSEKLAQKLDLNDKGYRTVAGLHGGLTGTNKTTGLSTVQMFKDADIYGKAIESAKDIETAAKILEGSDSATEALAAGKLRRAIPMITSRHTDPEMNYSSVAAAGMMGLAAHGFFGSEDIDEAAQVLTGGTYNKETGQWVEGDKAREHETVGFADKVMTRSEVIGAKSRPDVKAGYGHVVTEDGRIISGMSEEGGRALPLLETIGSGDIAQSKGGFVKAMGKTITEAIVTGEGDEARGAVAEIAAMPPEQREALSTTEEGRHKLTLARKAKLATSLKSELFKTAYKYSHSPIGTQADARAAIYASPELKKQFEDFERGAALVEETGRGDEEGGPPGAFGGGDPRLN